MKTKALSTGTAIEVKKQTDDAHATAHWGRPVPRRPGLLEIARLERRAEFLLFPLVGGCGLFAIATHFYGAVPVAHEMEVAWRECLRLAGIS